MEKFRFGMLENGMSQVDSIATLISSINDPGVNGGGIRDKLYR